MTNHRCNACGNLRHSASRCVNLRALDYWRESERLHRAKAAESMSAAACHGETADRAAAHVVRVQAAIAKGVAP